jgi:hypothetical protein
MQSMLHRDVKLCDVGHVGDWKLEKIHKIFVYLHANILGQATVGRALSGWRDATQGAFAPSMAGIPVGDHAHFRAFCLRFFNFPADWAQELRDAIGLIFLLRREEMEADFPENNLLKKYWTVAASIPGCNIVDWEQGVSLNYRTANSFYMSEPLAPSMHDLVQTTRQENLALQEVSCIRSHVEVVMYP